MVIFFVRHINHLKSVLLPLDLLNKRVTNLTNLHPSTLVQKGGTNLFLKITIIAQVNKKSYKILNSYITIIQLLILKDNINARGLLNIRNYLR